MFSTRPVISGTEQRPRSAAASAETSARPMFVGDVRCARPVGGCSCQLSGGRKLSSLVQKSAKYCQIFAASPSRKLLSASGRCRESRVSLPSPGVSSADTSQKMPAALPRGSGESTTSSAPSRTGGQSPNMRLALPSDCAAVCQESRLRLDMPMRQSAVSMAERQVAASMGSSASRSRSCKSRPPRPWGTEELSLSLSRRMRAEPSAGKSPVQSVKSPSSPAMSEAPEYRNRGQRMAARLNTGMRLRRRLSSSFHLSAKAKLRPRPKMKPRFCQSPRTQRCRRLK